VIFVHRRLLERDVVDKQDSAGPRGKGAISRCGKRISIRYLNVHFARAVRLRRLCIGFAPAWIALRTRINR